MNQKLIEIVRVDQTPPNSLSYSTDWASLINSIWWFNWNSCNKQITFWKPSNAWIQLDQFSKHSQLFNSSFACLHKSDQYQSESTDHLVSFGKRNDEGHLVLFGKKEKKSLNQQASN